MRPKGQFSHSCNFDGCLRGDCVEKLFNQVMNISTPASVATVYWKPELQPQTTQTR